MRLPSFLRKPAPKPPVPTTLYVTHAKAGSTWLDSIFRRLFGQQVAPRGKLAAAEVDGDLSRFHFTPGRIYSAMFMRYEQVAAHPELNGVQRFIVIRDLRDTLVSLYFSLKVSHPLEGDFGVAAERQVLQALKTESGFLHLIEGQLRGAAALQKSWLGRGETLLRYEDLIARDEEILRPLFLETLRLPTSPKAIQEALARCSFEAIFKRKLGAEDVGSHGRQGLPGDWRRHFTPLIAERFADEFGDVLVATGYESDRKWVETLR